MFLDWMAHSLVSRSCLIISTNYFLKLKWSLFHLDLLFVLFFLVDIHKDCLQSWPWVWGASDWSTLPFAAPLQPWPDLFQKLHWRQWAEDKISMDNTWPHQLYQPVILLPRKPKVDMCDLLIPFLYLALELSWLEGSQRCTEFLSFPHEDMVSSTID